MLTTPQLLLRPFTADDAADLLAYRSGPLPTCFACMRLEDLAAAQAEAAQLAREGDTCLAIVRREDGRVIGEITAFAESTTPGEGVTDTYSPCWMLHEDCRGQGYAYEAARAYFDYLFDVKGARRIYAYTETDNHASQRLCERLGMRREGVFVEFVTFVNNEDGTPKYEDTIQYAILKREWQARKGEPV